MAPFVLFIFTVILLVESSSGQTKCCVTTDSGLCIEQNCTVKQPVCLSVASNTNLSTELRPVYRFSRQCVESKNNLTGSFYFDFGNNQFLDFSSEYCSNPDCTTQLVDPPIRIYENGKYCPKCYRPGYDNCEEDGTVLCRGDLLNCSEVNGVISHVYAGMTTNIPFAAKGCASKSVCNIKQEQFFQFGTFKYTFKGVTCYEANSALASLRRLAFTLDRKDLGPQMTFFFPCILGIFAVKILS